MVDMESAICMFSEMLSSASTDEEIRHLESDKVLFLKAVKDFNSIHPKIIVPVEMKHRCFKSLLALHSMIRSASTDEEHLFAESERVRYLKDVEDFLQAMEAKEELLQAKEELLQAKEELVIASLPPPNCRKNVSSL